MPNQSVADEGVCCFCTKPLNRLESQQRTATVKTTGGELYVVEYHEHCFREWLGENQATAPLSLDLNGRVFRLC
jgi:hypothetical protein